MNDVCVIHNKFDSVGGAEVVAVEIAKIFNAPIYTTTKRTDYFDDEVEITPLLERGSNQYFYDELRRIRVFSKLTLPHDVVISKGVKTKFFKPRADQFHINHETAPTRMFYDLREQVRNSLPTYKKPIFDIAGSLFRWRIKKALNNIDKYLCNSEVVRERIYKYWGLYPEILYPPVDTEKYRNKESEGFFLYVGRLCPAKRVQEMIDAFKNSNHKLILVGDDQDGYEKQIRNINNIEYRGRVSEEEKIELLSRCEGVVYATMNEDFGLVPIEAFASGKPVIGSYEGFTKHQITEENGVFVTPTPQGIREGVNQITEKEFNPKEIQKHAQKFDKKIFANRLKEIVKGGK